MTISVRSLTWWCALLLVVLGLGPQQAIANARTAAPSITVIPYQGSYTGSLEVRGTGFTPGAAIAVVILDGDAAVQGVIKATAIAFATDGDGEISVLFPYEALAGDGPHRADPAMIMRTGIDVRNGCNQRDLVLVHDPVRDLWTSPVQVRC